MKTIMGLLVKSQQFYLRKMGYYHGEVDGWWGPDCQAALESWKSSPKDWAPANTEKDCTTSFIPFDTLPYGYRWEVVEGQRVMLQYVPVRELRAGDTPRTYNEAVAELLSGIITLQNATKATGRTAALAVELTEVEAEPRPAPVNAQQVTVEETPASEPCVQEDAPCSEQGTLCSDADPTAAKVEDDWVEDGDTKPEHGGQKFGRHHKGKNR